jgi:hypothetical protein
VERGVVPELWALTSTAVSVAPNNPTLSYRTVTQVQAEGKGGFSIGGNVVPGFTLPSSTDTDASEKQVGNYSLGTSELPWMGLVIKEDGV